MNISSKKSVLNFIAIILITCMCASLTFAEETAKPEKKKDTAKAAAKKNATNDSAKLGDKAGSLTGLTFVKGDPVTFQEGKVYVVEFWATWCGPCRTSIPHLTKVQKQYKDKGVTVIGITNEKDLDKIKNYVTKQGEKMDYTVAVDPKRKISKGYMAAYKQRGIPTAFVVDKKGNIAWVGHPMGGMDKVLTQVVDGTFDLKAYAKIKAEEDAKKAAQDAENSKLQKIFTEYFNAVKSGTEIEKTRAIAEKIMESKNPMALYSLSMNIMSIKDVDDAKRDYEMALKAITKANADTKGKDIRILNTYAMALSKNGKIKEAIDAQQKTIELAGDNKRLADYLNKQMEGYKKQLEEKNAPAPKETE